MTRLHGNTYSPLYAFDPSNFKAVCVFRKEYAIRVNLIKTRKEWCLECAALELYTKMSRVLIDGIFHSNILILPVIHHREITHILKSQGP